MSIAITDIRPSYPVRLAKGIALPGLREIAEVNKIAIASALCALFFVLYFFLPHEGTMAVLFQHSMIYIFALPFVAFVLALVSLRQIHRTHERGIILSYAALGVTSLYLIVAMAIPVVLLGLYIVYTFIL